VPPLQRFEDYFDFVYQKQSQLKAECGSVLGCPMCSVGSEVCTQDSAIRQKAQEIMDRYVKYFESTIRDAHAQGLIVAPDAKAKARTLFAYFQGTLSQARIANDLEVLRDLKTGAFAMLGLRQTEQTGPVAALSVSA